MPNSLDPDQARHYVGPDLVPNCLQKFSEVVGKELLHVGGHSRVFSIAEQEPTTCLVFVCLI